MIQKYLILVDEKSQAAALTNIKNTLKNDGIELIYKEFNPTNFQKREETGEIFFDIETFKMDLLSLPYFKQVDSIVSDYNLITDVIDGFDIIKIIKEINPQYKKQVILYSAQIEDVIDNIITNENFETQKENLKTLINCNIEFIKRNGYDQEVIKHIKKEKGFDFEDELIKWFYLRENDTFNYLFPIYEGRSFNDIAKELESKTPNSLNFKKELIEQIISYLSQINSLV